MRPSQDYIPPVTNAININAVQKKNLNWNYGILGIVKKKKEKKRKMKEESLMFNCIGFLDHPGSPDLLSFCMFLCLFVCLFVSFFRCFFLHSFLFIFISM